MTGDHRPRAVPVPMTQRSSIGRAEYRPDIDGLRGIAVTSVVLFHASVPGLAGGFAGVDIFFVISGYLIGGILFRTTREDSFAFADFYARRARRILPALLLVATCTMLAGAVLLSAGEYEKRAGSAFNALLALANFHYMSDEGYFALEAHLDPFLMTWSLAVEEQFYLFFPFVFLLLRRSDEARVLFVLGLICMVSFMLCVGLAEIAPSFAFYMLPTRTWELCLGSLLAVWIATGRWRPGGKLAEALSAGALATIAATTIFVDNEASWPGYATLAPVLAAGVLIATPGAAINRRLLSSAPFVGVGMVSYSWYLWHWPMISFVHIAAIGEPTRLALVTTASLSFLLAILSWHFVERPFRRFTLPPKSTLVRYGATLASALGAIALIVQLDGIPSRVPDRAHAIDVARARLHADNCLVYRRVELAQEGCLNTPKGKSVYAVIGDSQGAAIAPAVIDHAKRSGQGWAIFSHGSCRPLMGVTVVKTTDRGFAPICAEYMANAFAWVEGNPDVTDVLLSGLWAGPLRNADEHYSALDPDEQASGSVLLGYGLEAAVRRLVASGKRVHVALDLPYWTFNPSRARISETIPARRWLAAWSSRSGTVGNAVGEREPDFARLQEEISRITRRAGGHPFDPTEVFCEGGQCRYRDNRSVFFIDRSHLSPQGADLAFAALLDSAEVKSGVDPSGTM